MVAFIFWSICGCAIFLWGIYCIFSKKQVPFGFWANMETPRSQDDRGKTSPHFNAAAQQAAPIKQEPVSDVKKYNRAVGLLFCFFGVVFILLGTPLLAGQNSPWIIISILGAMFEAIFAMVIYVLVIEEKYRKR